MAQAALVAGSAIFVLIDAARRLGDPRAVQSTSLGIAVMALRDRRDPAPGLVPAPRRARGPARRRSTPTASTTAPTCSPTFDHRLARADAALRLAVARPADGCRRGALSRLARLRHRPRRGEGADGPRAAGRRRASGSRRSSWPIPRCRGCTTCARARPGRTQFIELHIEIDGAMSVARGARGHRRHRGRAVRGLPDRRGHPPPGAGGARGRAAGPPHRPRRRATRLSVMLCCSMT